jgi:hypothetical protein
MEQRRWCVTFLDKITIQRHVTFSNKIKVHKMYVWKFASRQARNGDCWQQLGRDRYRFEMKIDLYKPVLNRILDPNHRNKIYKERFQQLIQ